MGQIIKIDGVDEELVKVKSNDPGGFYTTTRKRMKSSDVEYIEPQIEIPAGPGSEDQYFKSKKRE